MTVLYTITLLVSTFFLVLYYISKWKYNYWEKKKVPYVKPLPIVGNYKDYLLMKKYNGTILHEMCLQFPDEPYFGTFFGTEPALVVKDPDLLKLIFTKDFYYFNGREVSNYINNEVITQNLLFLHGDQWKVTRQNLTPLFSSAKMKNMFYLIQNCNKAFEDMLQYETSLSETVDAKSLITRYTMDCICSCAFGVESNAMGKDQMNNPFKQMATKLLEPTITSGVKVAVRLMWPAIFYSLGLRWFPTILNDFFFNLLKNVFNKRGYEQSERNDFVDCILSFKKHNYIEGDSMDNAKTGGNKKVQLKVDDDMLVSLCVMFFAAGFETSSTALTFTLYELAKNPEIQERAREETDAYFYRHEKLEYGCVSELQYLEACLQEALRMYPLFGILTREVMDDYTFPSGLRVEKGMRIHIPTSYIHKNPEYFPDPLQYKPERHLPDAAQKIKAFTLLSFGEGPRTCIGMRFAKMQALAGLATVLKKYRIELADDTPQTIELDPKIYVAQSKNVVNLRLAKRDI